MLFLSCNQRSNNKLTYDISYSSDKGQTLRDVYQITKPVSFKDINLNAQLKFCTNIKWKLGFRFLAGRRRLRTKTNALIVSPAVADFCVGSFAVPSLFFCHITGGCNWPRPYAPWVEFIRWLFACASL